MENKMKDFKDEITALCYQDVSDEQFVEELFYYIGKYLKDGLGVTP